MLIKVKTTETSRNARKEKRLWHYGDRHSLSLGCTNCPDGAVCGGLQIENAPFDCLGFCCGNPEGCDVVCRNKPEDFAQRVREVGGFSLGNVPRAPLLNAPELPPLVPTIFHGDKRHGTFNASPVVCLPLYKVISRHDGSARYQAAQALADGFGIDPSVSVILTGTAVDPPLERWWSLGAGRIDAIRALKDLGIKLVTTPNFSLFTDQPRWDDMHSMKRIALVHEEFLREGLPAALHVNARTDRDWERWVEYVSGRPEITHIAFEFGTGGGWTDREEWHAQKLTHFAGSIGRAVHMILRGGTNVLPALKRAFPDITVLETSAFLKTVKRQRAKLNEKGLLDWTPSPTASTEMLDHLFVDNWNLASAHYTRILAKAKPPEAA